MAYATVIDVAARDRGRDAFTSTSKPTQDEVVSFLEYSGAVIDGKLRARGYTVPVPTTATGALQFLKGMNADGAACMVQKAATNSDRREEYCAVWDRAMEMLEVLDLDIPLDAADSGTVSYDSGSSMFTMDIADRSTGYGW